jgi:excisionase family DNA binding protein
VVAPKPKLTRLEIARVFDGNLAARFLPIVSPGQLAELTGLSVKTIYFWIAEGRLDGAFRKRGKHCLIWRDRAIDVIFNGEQWSENECLKETESPSGNA